MEPRAKLAVMPASYAGDMGGLYQPSLFMAGHGGGWNTGARSSNAPMSDPNRTLPRVGAFTTERQIKRVVSDTSMTLNCFMPAEVSGDTVNDAADLPSVHPVPRPVGPLFPRIGESLPSIKRTNKRTKPSENKVTPHVSPQLRGIPGKGQPLPPAPKLLLAGPGVAHNKSAVAPSCEPLKKRICTSWPSSGYSGSLTRKTTQAPTQGHDEEGILDAAVALSKMSGPKGQQQPNKVENKMLHTSPLPPPPFHLFHARPSS